MFKKEKIKNFQNLLKQDENNRYQSWKHCYEAFGDITKDNDYLALHLGFYLASWGMYRGSTGLLQKDYKIHIGAVKIVKEYHKDLRCSQNLEVSINNIYAIINLKEELFNHYNQYKYQTKENTFEPKPPTHTLLSKIVLGTLGCSPAFDRYFNEGTKLMEVKASKFEKKDFEELFKFIERNKTEIIQFQKELLREEGVYYPVFKLVDMFFWNEGFSKNN